MLNCNNITIWEKYSYENNFMRSVWVHHTWNKRTSLNHYCLVSCYSSCTSLIFSTVLSVVLYVSFTFKLIIILASFALFSIFTSNNASTLSSATPKVTFFCFNICNSYEHFLSLNYTFICNGNIPAIVSISYFFIISWLNFVFTFVK